MHAVCRMPKTDLDSVQDRVICHAAMVASAALYPRSAAGMELRGAWRRSRTLSRLDQSSPALKSAPTTTRDYKFCFRLGDTEMLGWKKSGDADAAAKLDAVGRSQAVIEFNLDGTIITANQNFLSAMGYTLAEIEGKHHGMFVEPAYRESAEYKAFWEKLRRGEHESAAFKRLAKGGKEIWIEASYNP